MIHGNIFHDKRLVFSEYMWENGDVEQNRHFKMLSNIIIVVAIAVVDTYIIRLLIITLQ